MTDGTDAPRRIVLWGATGAGKSTYLSTLVFFHQQAVDERRLCVLPGDAVTAAWVARQVQALCGGAGTPAARVQTRETRELRFRLHELPARTPAAFAQRRPARCLGELRVWDVPGATYDATPPTELLDAMLDASGIVLLVDPGHRPAEGAEAYYTRFFQATLGALVLRLRAQTAGTSDPRLGPDNRLRIPVAVCLTKADEHAALFDNDDRRELLRQVVGSGAGLLETSLTTHTVIALSALGDALETRDGQAVLADEPRPRNVLRPLRWILDQPAPTRRAAPRAMPNDPRPSVHDATTIELAAVRRPASEPAR